MRTCRNSLAQERGIRLKVRMLRHIHSVFFPDYQTDTISVGPLFGTFIRATATPAEVTWSSTFQTAFANFIKDPSTSPAVHWPKYVPGPATKTLAKLAYNGNVDPDNFVDAVQSNSLVSFNLTTSFVDFLLR